MKQDRECFPIATNMLMFDFDKISMGVLGTAR